MKLTELNQYFEGFPLIYLATAIDNKPFVRAMSLIFHNGKLWCCSNADRKKIQQIRKNPSIEFCLLTKDGSEFHNIRGRGEVIEIQNHKIRQELSNEIPYFKEYWKSADDPNFILLELKIREFEYHPPGGKSFVIFDIENNDQSEFSKNYRNNIN